MPLTPEEEIKKKTEKKELMEFLLFEFLEKMRLANCDKITITDIDVKLPRGFIRKG